jgi:hypothetical protein
MKAEEAHMIDLIMPIVAWGVFGGMIGGALLIWCALIIYGAHRLGGWIGPLIRARMAASLGRSRRPAARAGEI